MDKAIFYQAKRLRETIDHISVKMSQVQRMREREDDDDFNTCRKIAYDALNDAKQRYENDFKTL